MGLGLFLQGPVQQAVSTGPVQPWNQCKSVGLAPLSGSKLSDIFMICCRISVLKAEHQESEKYAGKN